MKKHQDNELLRRATQNSQIQKSLQTQKEQSAFINACGDIDRLRSEYDKIINNHEIIRDAARNGNSEFWQKLVDEIDNLTPKNQVFDFLLADDDGTTNLHLMCTIPHSFSCRKHSKETTTNFKDRKLESAKKIVDRLSKNEILAQDIRGNSALHLAVKHLGENRTNQLIEYMISKNKLSMDDINGCKNCDDKSPYDIMPNRMVCLQRPERSV